MSWLLLQEKVRENKVKSQHFTRNKRAINQTDIILCISMHSLITDSNFYSSGCDILGPLLSFFFSFFLAAASSSNFFCLFLSTLYGFT
jgi:hypothetical protein